MDLASSMLEALSGTSKFKRLEQLKRWDDSETNKESSALKDGPRKINFSDGCVFLAACSAGDKEEVQRLIEKGADIDTANIDGLTALHQACIDDNLEMVEFLVENGADVNRGDNEGWTPLHATASCGFISIAKYLIENGSNIAAVNNDGELPFDIAESEEMEELLQEEMNKREIDCEAARHEEENRMLEDANRWLSSGNFGDRPHPKTGATALHVAAAKGYIKVMNLLLQAGADINALDLDGWTPLHGAAHWGQKEACEMLVENMCDMDIKNVAGQTAIDVADPDLVKLLEELRIKQSTILNDNSQSLAILEHNAKMKGKLQMRMSSNDKTQLTGKDKFYQHNQNETPLISDKVKRKRDKKNEFPLENSGSSENSESEDSEIEKRNKVNKNESFNKDHNEVLGNKEGKSDHLRIQESTKQIPNIGENEDDIPVWRRGIRKNETISSVDQPNEIIPRPTPASRSSFPPNSNISNENDEEISKSDRRRPISLESDERFSKFGMFVWQNRHNRPNSLPASMTTTTTTTTTATGTAGIVVTTVTQISAVNSSPLFSRKSDDLHSQSKILSSDEHVDKLIAPVAVVTSLPSTTPSITTTTVTTTTATTPSTPSTPTSNQVRRSFAPPVRDEESETQRKAHAKRVRETRRSTQGVTLEEVKSAEQLIKKQQENAKDKENHNSKGDTLKDRLYEISKDQENISKELERRPSWRVRLEQDKNKIDEVRVTHRIREAPVETPTTTDLSSSTTSSTPYIRRSRIPSLDNDTVNPAISTATGTVRTRSSRTEDDVTDHDKDTENNVNSSSSNIQATQAAIHRRRRPKRRSTGVVYTDVDDSDGSQEAVDYIKKTEEENETDSQTSSDRGFRSRFGSSGSIPDTTNRNDSSRLNDRTSQSTVQNEKEEKEYKKLYEEMKTDNERLREVLSRKEKELQDYKQRCEKLQLLQKTSSSDAEKRERRALERKLSEYEEELKQMEQLRTDNQRLRDENGALIRVISKLSK